MITIEDARKKLGKRGKNMTDKEVNSLLSTLRLLCNKVIDDIVEKDYSENNL